MVCRWKTPRSGPRVAANTAADVEAATRAALATIDEHARMTALLELTGIGIPTASTLLHFAAEDGYPILDVRALESLGERGRSTYTVSYWLGYLEACRSLAAEHGVDVRTLDKALWQYSKERSGRTD
jgi:thermostable 8-oxoguanine DNA glycosylase